jgi:integrase|tara:strand:+ start:112 stop:1401 length:1290 start_codon:yes stop_codon:yes gene_type:complete
MPKYLQKRRRRWYAVMEVPKPLRSKIGRPRYFQSLNTESLSVAEARVLPIVVNWKKEIALANGEELFGSDTELMNNIIEVRKDEKRLKDEGYNDSDIKYIHDDIALSARSWDEELGEFVTDNEDLVQAISVVHGVKFLLIEHLDSYLSSLKVTPKSNDSYRFDIIRFLNRFKYADDVNEQDLNAWINVTLGEDEGLSVSTQKRIISSCRGYWKYLRRSRNLIVKSPFTELYYQSSKPTKKDIEDKRKAFTVSDYHTLLGHSQHDDTLQDLIILGAFTGCRIDELCSLKLSEVRSDRIEIIDAKTEAGWRTIPLHKDIKQLVARLVDTSSSKYLISGLTFNKYGNRSNAIGKRFGRLKKNLGYGSDHVFHSLRKGFATHLENAVVPESTVSRLMGHTIKGQSFGNYSDGLMFDKLVDAINKISWKEDYNI